MPADGAGETSRGTRAGGGDEAGPVHCNATYLSLHVPSTPVRRASSCAAAKKRGSREDDEKFSYLRHLAMSDFDLGKACLEGEGALP